MSTGDLIVLLAIAVLLWVAIRTLRRKPDSCDNVCSGCAFSAGCTKKNRT